MIRAKDVVENLEAAIRRHQAGDISGAAAAYDKILTVAPDHPDALHHSGIAAFQLGRLDEAVSKLSAAVARAPNVAAWHSNLANALRRSGASQRALAAYDVALSLDPTLTEARFGRALVHQAGGAVDAAIADWQALLADAPGNADARNNLGAAFLAAGRPADALSQFDALVAAGHESADIQRNRALALDALGRDRETQSAFERALALRPEDLGMMRSYAAWLVGRRRLDEAIALYVHSDKLHPGDARTLNDLGVAWLERGNAEVALETLRRAATLAPESALVRTNLGNALRAVGDLAGAIAEYRSALARDATMAETFDNLATALRDRGQLDEAAASYEAALRLRPNFVNAIGNLANLRLELGDTKTASELYRRALAAAPVATDIHRNYLLAILYDPSIDAKARDEAHIEFGRRHSPSSPLPPAKPAPLAGRRIRVAYVSSDFRDHPVARTVAPIVARHDRTRFEVFVYSDVAHEDITTANIKACVAHWHDNAGVDDLTLARRIRADGIDVLVCVAGRFDRNRPLLAAWRPAPVQLALGEVATTGIDAYDGIFADPVLVPRDGVEAFVERPLRLPRYFVHVPLAAPDPQPPPSISGAAPVFGCFNNPIKIGDGVLDLWVRLLARVPGSRLMLKYKNLYSVPTNAARVRAAFVRGGIDPARAVLLSSVDALDGHLARYAHVDVALDPFPFSGSTATFEALWMGVPVVAMAGRYMAGRWSAAMLTALGRQEWIANDPDSYIATAMRVAADGTGRARLRTTLRQEVENSSLCDVAGRTRQIERVYAALVRRVIGAGSR